MLIAIDADPALGEAAVSRLQTATGLPPLAGGEAEFVLYRGPERLELRATGFQPLYVDFSTGKARHRRLQGGGKGQLVARAVGLRRHPLADVLDATAGFGQDAFVLASLGARVTLLERSPVVHALLEDGLARAARDAAIAAIVSRMTLVRADTADWLGETRARPEVIHLDPMFPPSGKHARVKKAMQHLHRLIGQDKDAATLLQLARRHATRRVCVKRALHAPPLGDAAPHAELRGKRARYDLYAPLGSPAKNGTKR